MIKGLLNIKQKVTTTLFSEKELITLEKVANTFKTTSTSDIIEMSHLENAWKKNVNEKSTISYEYAFELMQI